MPTACLRSRVRLPAPMNSLFPSSFSRSSFCPWTWCQAAYLHSWRYPHNKNPAMWRSPLALNVAESPCAEPVLPAQITSNPPNLSMSLFHSFSHALSYFSPMAQKVSPQRVASLPLSSLRMSADSKPNGNKFLGKAAAFTAAASIALSGLSRSFVGCFDSKSLSSFAIYPLLSTFFFDIPYLARVAFRRRYGLAAL